MSIQSLIIQTVQFQPPADAVLRLTVKAVNSSDTPVCEPLVCEIDGDKNARFDFGDVILGGGQAKLFTRDFRYKPSVVWRAGSGGLLTMTARQGVSVLSAQFGIRTVTRKDGVLLINNETLDPRANGFPPECRLADGSVRPLTLDAVAPDINERLDDCDFLGLPAFLILPVVGGEPADVKRAVLRIMDAFANRPSVIGWIIPGGLSDIALSGYRLAIALDPFRLS
ncbi:MAG: hypothetical protein ABIH86_01560 [Planctomycetota bacterium]